MKRVPLSHLKEGTEFLIDTSWGDRLARVDSFFRADRVWVVFLDDKQTLSRDWVRTDVEVLVDDGTVLADEPYKG